MATIVPWFKSARVKNIARLAMGLLMFLENTKKTLGIRSCFHLPPKEPAISANSNKKKEVAVHFHFTKIPCELNTVSRHIEAIYFFFWQNLKFRNFSVHSYERC